MDELCALRSAVKDGEVSEPQALKHLSRSPRGVWVATDPVSELLLALDVGDRTLADVLAAPRVADALPATQSQASTGDGGRSRRV